MYGLFNFFKLLCFRWNEEFIIIIATVDVIHLTV